MLNANLVEQRELMDTNALFREYRETKDVNLRNEIVEQNLHLASIIARKYVNRGVDYDDLYQVASYALLLAVERYDPDKGVQFASYATPTIIGEIKKYFRDTSWALKVPRRIKEISTKIPAARESLEKKINRVPTVKELSEYMETSEEEILEALESRRAYTAFSLDQAPDDQEESENASFEKYLGENEEGYEDFENSGVLETVLADLSPMERDVIKRRLGKEMTQKEVAELLGISQMTVSRIEKAMREKFRTEYNL